MGKAGKINITKQLRAYIEEWLWKGERRALCFKEKDLGPTLGFSASPGGLRVAAWGKWHKNYRASLFLGISAVLNAISQIFSCAFFSVNDEWIHYKSGILQNNFSLVENALLSVCQCFLTEKVKIQCKNLELPSRFLLILYLILFLWKVKEWKQHVDAGFPFENKQCTRFPNNTSVTKLKQNCLSPQEWTNHLIHWKPADYEGVEQISLDASQIWQPDMVLYNK